MAAAFKGHAAIVKMLVENKPPADVNEGGNAGTPLLSAAILGDGRLVRYLLEHGADVCATFAGPSPKDIIRMKHISGVDRYLNKKCSTDAAR